MDRRNALSLLGGAALLVALGRPSPALGQAITSTTTDRINIDGTIAHDLAACGGEDVELFGNILIMSHVSTDSQGGVHVRLLVTGQGVMGVGVTTGNQYVANGTSPNELDFFGSGGLPVTMTVGEDFHLISKGKGANVTIHQLIHVTVNPNGTVTSSVDTFSIDCRG
jgi:hypothetical protein